MAGKSRDVTTKFRVDLSEFKSGIQQANKDIKLANAEFKAASAGMDDWSKSSEGLNAKIKQLNTILESEKSKLANLEAQQSATIEAEKKASKAKAELKKQIEIHEEALANVIERYGEYSEETEDAKKHIEKLKAEYKSASTAQKAHAKAIQDGIISIKNQEAAVKKTEKEMNDFEGSLDKVEKAEKKAAKSGKSVEESLKDIEKSAEKTEGSLSKLSKGLGGMAKAGIAGIGAAAAGLAAGFLASGEASQEFVEDMGKLDVAFTTSGHSAETGKKAYEDFVGLLGETDRSVEAVNHLAKLTKSEEELAQWTDIAAGVYATFGDSLPIEGLTEAANETAKLGKLTGPLTDALNWAGINEEKFQAQLDACSTEQERAALITKTLNGLYKEAGDKYQELNADLIASRKASSDFSEAMAEIGQVAMPINTMIKQFGADLLNALVPGLKEAAQGLKEMFAGTEGGSEKLQKGVQSIVDGLLNKITSVLPTIAQLGVQLITSLVQGILNSSEQILGAIYEISFYILDSIATLLPQIVTAVMELIPQLLDTIFAIGEQIVLILPSLITQIVQALADGIPQLIDGALRFFMAIVEVIPTIIDELARELPKIIDIILEAVVKAIPQLLKAAVKLLTAIVDAIPKILPPLIEALPKIIDSIINVLIENIPAILDGAIELLMAIIRAVPVIIKALVPQIPKIVTSIVNTLIKNIPVLLDGAIQLLMAIIKAIPTIVVEIAKAAPDIINGLLGALKQTITEINWGELGLNIVEGIVNGMINIGNTIWNGVKKVGKKIKDGFKDFFGIKSPSRVMADEVGKFLTQGMGVGALDEIDNVKKDLNRGLSKMVTQLNIPTIDIVGNASGGGFASNSKQGSTQTINFYQTNNSPKSLSRLEIYRQTNNALNRVKGGLINV